MKQQVVIVGAGFGGLRAARALKSAPVDVTSSTGATIVSGKSLAAKDSAIRLFDAPGPIEVTETQSCSRYRV